jgi:SNF2 family DNA or RNA helicase
MGLGKTMSAAAVLSDIFEDASKSGARTLPAIVVAPLSTLDTWKSELAQSAAASLRVVVYVLPLFRGMVLKFCSVTMAMPPRARGCCRVRTSIS